MVIMTERLVLRRFTAKDAEGLHSFLGDEEAVKYEPYGTFTLKECKREATLRGRSDIYWAVCLRQTGEVIGNVSLTKQPQATWELGYILRRSAWGQGYATEAATAMLDRTFGALRAHRVTARCNPLNTASARLLQRLGMRLEGRQVKNAYFRTDSGGEPLWQDTLLYAVLREEWPAVRPACPGAVEQR